MAVALAFTIPAFACHLAAAQTEPIARRLGGMWDAATNTCAEKKM
jgi:hypothetical protein